MPPSCCRGADLILDGTDNFATRYLINDFAVSRNIPWIYGAAVGSYGLAMPVIPGTTACLRCVYPEPPQGIQPTCETAGVLNVIASLVASYQVADALKILCGRADLVQARITRVDIWQGGTRQTEAPPRDPECPTCGRGEFPYLDESRRDPVTLCGRNAVQIHEREQAIDLAELKAAAGRAGRGARQRVRAAIPYCALRNDHIPRRPGDHQGHRRSGLGAKPVRALRGAIIVGRQ